MKFFNLIGQAEDVKSHYYAARTTYFSTGNKFLHWNYSMHEELGSISNQGG